MGSFKSLNTVRDFGSATTIIPIKVPGVGETGETLTIRSRYHEAFREADAKAQRELATLTIANKGAAPDADTIKKVNDIAFAALVEDWSYDEPCTAENVVEFFEANPQIFDEVNRKAAMDSLFLNPSVKK